MDNLEKVCISKSLSHWCHCNDRLEQGTTAGFVKVDTRDSPGSSDGRQGNILQGSVVQKGPMRCVQVIEVVDGIALESCEHEGEALQRASHLKLAGVTTDAFGSENPLALIILLEGRSSIKDLDDRLVKLISA